MSDFSAYYQLEVEDLDGTTVAAPIQWTSNTPTQYRGAVRTIVGRVPIDLFTRSAADPGGKSPPASIAREGALVIARWVGTTNETTEIGVWPMGGVQATQRQQLTSDLSVKLWTFPGDEVWLLNNGPAPARGRIDFFIRSLNFRDLDTLLSLPIRPLPNAGTAITTVASQASIPMPTAARMIYVLSPQVADQVYLLPDADAVSGIEMIFVNSTNVRCGLTASTAIQEQAGVVTHFLGPRMTAELISYGSNYTDRGVSGDQFVVVNGVTVFGAWRGVLNVRITSIAAFTLPQAATVSATSVMIIHNADAVAATLAAAAGESINGAANLAIPAGATFAVRQHTLTSWVAI